MTTRPSSGNETFLPWFPNESDSLVRGTNQLHSALAAVDRALADTQRLGQGVWWSGPDADHFRNRVTAEQVALRNTRRQIVAAIAQLGRTVDAEQNRFRLQENERRMRGSQ